MVNKANIECVYLHAFIKLIFTNTKTDPRSKHILLWAFQWGLRMPSQMFWRI